MATITEALAEIKTITKKVEKKRAFVINYLYRQEALRDPLASSGGTVQAIKSELQSIGDLENRLIGLRSAILSSNKQTMVTINGMNMSLCDWLTWRKEVAPQQQRFYKQLSDNIVSVRHEAARKGVASVAAEAAAKPGDILVNLDEKELSDKMEEIETILGTLDGTLSLKNATTQIEEV